MAFPSLEAQNPALDSSTGGAATSGDTAATSHSVVLPVVVSAGSLLIIYGRVAAAGAITITGGGWTIDTDTNDAADDVHFWAYKNTLADGSEGGTSVTVNHGSARMVAVSASYLDAEDPATQAPQRGTAIGTNTTPNPPLFSPPGGSKDYLWVWFGSWDGEQTLNKTPTANYSGSGDVDVSCGTAGATTANVQCKVSYRQLTAATEDPGSVTLSVAPTGWTAYTIAIYPKTVATPSVKKLAAMGVG